MVQIPDPVAKQAWFEINSQILNGCFTITAVLTQPIRFKLLIWTIKWYYASKQVDREIYAALIAKECPDIKLRISRTGSVHNHTPQSATPEPVATADSCTPLNKQGSPVDKLPSPADTQPASPGNSDGNFKQIAGQDVSIALVPLESNSIAIITAPIKLCIKEPTPTWKWLWIVFFLNGQCVFQYPITVVQWMYIGRVSERPSLVIAAFLPLSFLCGGIGGIWPLLIGLSSKKKEEGIMEKDSEVGEQRIIVD